MFVCTYSSIGTVQTHVSYQNMHTYSYISKRVRTHILSQVIVAYLKLMRHSKHHNNIAIIELLPRRQVLL